MQVLKRVQDFFRDKIQPDSTHTQHSNHALQLATAALLYEMTGADFEIKEEERSEVEALLIKNFSLTRDETRELTGLAEQRADKAACLHEFTILINRNFSPQEKIRVIEMLWQVALSDGHLDRYEEGLVRKIAELIHVSHRDFIHAKHRVEAGIKSAG